MAYNPYSAVNAIYNLKGQWENANNIGDTATKNSVAAKAQVYYNQLKNNGYNDVADELTASNYSQAKAINDKWAKMGKTATRPYLYSLGSANGMSSKDIDNLIEWDNQTGEVSFGGKKIGTPDSVVDGVSYWSDTSKLDNAFKEYTQRSNTNLSSSSLSSKNSTEINDKINQLWGLQQSDHSDISNMWKEEYDSLKNTNPFTTDEAKTILAKYDLAGLQGRDNAAASNAGSNGGNIDSFAAANALRQQSALINQGQQVVLDSYQQKLDNARAILEGLGVYQQNNYTGMQNTIGLQQNEAQRLFENDETAKNNDVARKSEIASVSGYTPDEWVVSNNPYMNDDGTIKDEYKDIDFSAVMANAKAAGNTDAYNAASVARYYKIMGNYQKYGQYDDGNYTLPGQSKTESARQFDEQIAAADRALSAEQNSANADRELQRDLADKTAQNALDQIKTSAIYGVNTKSGTSSSSNKTSTNSVEKEKLKNETSDSVWGWFNTLDTMYDNNDTYKNYSDSNKQIYVTAEKLSDDKYIQYAKKQLVNGGYSNKDAEKEIEKYRENTAIAIVKAEKKNESLEDGIKRVYKKYGWLE